MEKSSQLCLTKEQYIKVSNNIKIPCISIIQLNPDGITVEEIKAMDARGEIHRKLNKAMKKDTIGVPDGGYTLLRFKASNPGQFNRKP